MLRQLGFALAVAVLGSPAIAQTRLELRQLLGDLPLIQDHRAADVGRAYLFSTPEGHGLHVNWKRDSSVLAFVVHPASSVGSESAREAFVRRVATNAFGSDSAISDLLKRAAEKRGRSSTVQHELVAGGWTLTLITQQGRIVKLMARARNAARP